MIPTGLGRSPVRRACLSHARLGQAYYFADRLGDAEQSLETSLLLNPGAVPASDRALDGVSRMSDGSGPYHVARAYAFRDQRDEALDWLESAYESRDGDLTYLLVDPRWPSFGRRRAGAPCSRNWGCRIGSDPTRRNGAPDRLLRAMTREIIASARLADLFRAGCACS